MKLKPIIHEFKHINDYGKRSVQAVQNVAPDLDKMSSVIASRRPMLVQNAEREMIQFLDGRRKKTPHLIRLENFDRRVAELIGQAKNYHSMLGDVFGDNQADVNKDRRTAFNRIPIEKFALLDQAPEGEERLALMNALIDEEMESKGNGCGHSDKSLLNSGQCSQYDYNPEGKRLLPRILWETMDRLAYAVLFPDKYKDLFFHKTTRKVDRWAKKIRQIRSEGRVGMVRVLNVLLEHMDKVSLRTGFIDQLTGDFYGISREILAKLCNMSVSRVKTALRNLEETEILYATRKQKREYDEDADKWKGFPIVRKFKITLFKHLGLKDQLDEHRDPDAYAARVAKHAREMASERERFSADAKVSKEIANSKKAAQERIDRERSDSAEPRSRVPSNIQDMIDNGAEPDFS